MARFYEPTPDQVAAWHEWVADRPPVVRAVAERLDPWSLYRLRPSTHRVTLVSIAEDGTVTVNVSAEFNAVLFERSVFGIDPDNLEPCDLPSPHEPLGQMLADDEVDGCIDQLRVQIRPDLWAIGDDGVAVRKV